MEYMRLESSGTNKTRNIQNKSWHIWLWTYNAPPLNGTSQDGCLRKSFKLVKISIDKFEMGSIIPRLVQAQVWTDL